MHFIIIKNTLLERVFFCGGDEESRTPVQQLFRINFSECSLLLKFLYSKLTNKLIRKVVSKVPTICETTNSFVSH